MPTTAPHVMLHLRCDYPPPWPTVLVTFFWLATPPQWPPPMVQELYSHDQGFKLLSAMAIAAQYCGCGALRNHIAATIAVASSTFSHNLLYHNVTTTATTTAI